MTTDTEMYVIQASGGVNLAIPAWHVNRFIVDGGLGADRIDIDTSIRATIIGSGGDDTLVGGSRDIFDGGAGDDVLVGPPRVAFGGRGNDLLDCSSFQDDIVIRLDGTGLSGPTGATFATISADIENATSGEGNDEIIGNASRNELRGSGGDDTLIGAGENDSLFGGSGNDYLDGNTGRNRLVGGAGNDELLSGSGS